MKHSFLCLSRVRVSRKCTSIFRSGEGLETSCQQRCFQCPDQVHAPSIMKDLFLSVAAFDIAGGSHAEESTELDDSARWQLRRQTQTECMKQTLLHP